MNKTQPPCITKDQIPLQILRSGCWDFEDGAEDIQPRNVQAGQAQFRAVRLVTVSGDHQEPFNNRW